jgi:uncharacterized cupin superfamily protein
MTVPIRLSPTGPAGFLQAAGKALPTATLIEGSPVGADHVYFERPEARLKVGIWHSSACTEFYEDYPCDEFMVVLEGHVIVENERSSERFDPGDAFLIPKGFRGYWRQPVAMTKYYAIVE